MADYVPPAELVEAQQALDAAMRACEQLASELPAWSAIQRGEAEPDLDGEQRLADARAERARLMDRVYGDEWLKRADNWLQAKQALEKAARADVAS
ncbi:hypothetical protein [Planobispora rosea]|uniref:hypothetical protein n=1 Tax=Planobispora rosea TaxID=35762 RepID=UPI00083A9750|nr:hypothetical protein [Planobispora rosea]